MKKYIIVLAFLFSAFLGIAQSYNLEQGIKAYENDDLDKAIEYFGREINDNPKSTLALYYRAVIYFYNEQNLYALKDISNAIKFLNAKDKIWLVGAHKLRAKIYYEIEDYDKCFEEFATALKINPTETDIFLERAQIYFDLKQYSKAEEDYKKALKIDETLILAYAGLGRNYINQKNYTEAEKILNRLIKLSPDYTTGHKLRARMYYELGKYDLAIEDIFNAFEIDQSDKMLRSIFIDYGNKNHPLSLSKVNAKISAEPEKGVWYFIRAQLYEKKYNYNSAITDYTKLIELSDIEYLSSILSYRAESFFYAGMPEKAIADYNKIISIDSLNAYYYGYRGQIFRFIGDYKNAKSDFLKAISLKPTESWFYSQKGLVEELAMNNEEALSDFSTSIQLEKLNSYTYFCRARLYETKFNDKTKALEDYNTILSIDTNKGNNANCLPYTLFHLGRTDEAISKLNEIIKEYPTPFNYYDAACLYSLMKRPSDAIQYLTLAFQNGYRNFSQLDNDANLTNIQNNPEFKTLVSEWKSRHENMIKNAFPEPIIERAKSPETISIPLKPNGGGTYEISCKINDLALNLIFDTGASDISISQTEVQFMLKNGYLSHSDITGTQKYIDANGDIEVGTTIIFRKVDFGGLILTNVKASVVHNKNAPLLFGQSALGKYGKIIIDNEKKILTISK